jgi:hypothetical protein
MPGLNSAILLPHNRAQAEIVASSTAMVLPWRPTICDRHQRLTAALSNLVAFTAPNSRQFRTVGATAQQWLPTTPSGWPWGLPLAATVLPVLIHSRTNPATRDHHPATRRHRPNHPLPPPLSGAPSDQSTHRARHRTLKDWLNLDNAIAEAMPSTTASTSSPDSGTSRTIRNADQLRAGPKSIGSSADRGAAVDAGSGYF